MRSAPENAEGAAQAARAKGSVRAKGSAGDAPRPSSAERVAGVIRRGVEELCPDAEFDVDVAVIESIIRASFWSGARSKLYLLTSAEDLVQFPSNEAAKFLRRRHGSPVDVEQLAGAFALPDERKRAARDISAAVFGPIIDYLKYANQRDAVEWHIDMFAKRARMELVDDRVSITLTHRPVAVDPGDDDDAVVNDFREHFPELDDVLAFIVAGRFALDRKKAYLWMHCASDWGKGFLLGVLSSLGLVVQMSVKEIEGAFEGRPAGRRPEDFKRAFVLAVDEFKSVKSELKQLQSEMWISPKHQLTAKVDLYTKLFLSAENVASLVGDHGVEDQFANRMSLITATGDLTVRPLYVADQGRYFRAVKAYVGREINRLVGEYRREGRHGSERRAAEFLKDFAGRRGLAKKFERLSDSYARIGAEAIEWARKENKIVTAGGGEYLTHANRALDDFFKATMAHSDMVSISRRKPEILLAMSVDGRGNGTHRIRGGKPTKCVKLKDGYDEVGVDAF